MGRDQSDDGVGSCGLVGLDVCMVRSTPKDLAWEVATRRAEEAGGRRPGQDRLHARGDDVKTLGAGMVEIKQSLDWLQTNTETLRHLLSWEDVPKTWACVALFVFMHFYPSFALLIAVMSLFALSAHAYAVSQFRTFEIEPLRINPEHHEIGSRDRLEDTAGQYMRKSPSGPSERPSEQGGDKSRARRRRAGPLRSLADAWIEIFRLTTRVARADWTDGKADAALREAGSVPVQLAKAHNAHAMVRRGASEIAATAPTHALFSLMVWVFSQLGMGARGRDDSPRAWGWLVVVMVCALVCSWISISHPRWVIAASGALFIAWGSPLVRRVRRVGAAVASFVARRRREAILQQVSAVADEFVQGAD